MPQLKSFYNLSENDYGGERTTTQYGIPELTELNLPVVMPALGALKSAHDGITLGVMVQDELIFARNKTAASNVKATSKQAQRENKWLIRYFDVTTFAQFVLEVGCADLTLLQTDGDRVNLTEGSVPAGAWAAYKLAFETVVDTPDGNDAELIEAIYVGRNT